MLVNLHRLDDVALVGFCAVLRKKSAIICRVFDVSSQGLDVGIDLLQRFITLPAVHGRNRDRQPDVSLMPHAAGDVRRGRVGSGARSDPHAGDPYRADPKTSVQGTIRPGFGQGGAPSCRSRGG